MNTIIVCHTEFGYVKNNKVIFNKKATRGVSKGVINLSKIADRYRAKVSFALMPEVAKKFPQKIKHEIGLHIHPGWIEHKYNNTRFYVGDKYLKEHCSTSVNSTVLKDYPLQEQLALIKTGTDLLKDKFKKEPKIFVAGRWSVNNDTIKALIQAEYTHDCSAPAHQKTGHYDWSKLPRICMPYRPSEKDYQKRGNLPLLIIPISQYFPSGNVNPEVVPILGLHWLKACFLEYYRQNAPLFHICLHSPSMTDPYFTSSMDELLNFISTRKDIDFKFASEIVEYFKTNLRTTITPYLFHINKNLIKNFLKLAR